MNKYIILFLSIGIIGIPCELFGSYLGGGMPHLGGGMPQQYGRYSSKPGYGAGGGQKWQYEGPPRGQQPMPPPRRLPVPNQGYGGGNVDPSVVQSGFQARERRGYQPQDQQYNPFRGGQGQPPQGQQKYSPHNPFARGQNQQFGGPPQGRLPIGQGPRSGRPLPQFPGGQGGQQGLTPPNPGFGQGRLPMGQRPTTGNRPLSMPGGQNGQQGPGSQSESTIFKRGPGLDNAKLDMIEEVKKKADTMEARRQDLAKKKDLFPINKRYKEPAIDPRKMDRQSYEFHLKEAQRLIKTNGFEVIQNILKMSDPSKMDGKFGYKSEISQDLQAYVHFISLALGNLEKAVENLAIGDPQAKKKGGFRGFTNKVGGFFRDKFSKNPQHPSQSQPQQQGPGKGEGWGPVGRVFGIHN